MAHTCFCLCTAIIDEDDIEKKLRSILIKHFGFFFILFFFFFFFWNALVIYACISQKEAQIQKNKVIKINAHDFTHP